MASGALSREQNGDFGAMLSGKLPHSRVDGG
jgi:hypothetical protein